MKRGNLTHNCDGARYSATSGSFRKINNVTVLIQTLLLLPLLRSRKTANEHFGPEPPGVKPSKSPYSPNGQRVGRRKSSHGGVFPQTFDNLTFGVQPAEDYNFNQQTHHQRLAADQTSNLGQAICPVLPLAIRTGCQMERLRWTVLQGQLTNPSDSHALGSAKWLRSPL